MQPWEIQLRGHGTFRVVSSVSVFEQYLSFPSSSINLLYPLSKWPARCGEVLISGILSCCPCKLQSTLELPKSSPPNYISNILLNLKVQQKSYLNFLFGKYLNYDSPLPPVRKLSLSSLESPCLSDWSPWPLGTTLNQYDTFSSLFFTMLYSFLELQNDHFQIEVLQDFLLSFMAGCS